jgi:hypothetical protein
MLLAHFIRDARSRVRGLISPRMKREESPRISLSCPTFCFRDRVRSRLITRRPLLGSVSELVVVIRQLDRRRSDRHQWRRPGRVRSHPPQTPRRRCGACCFRSDRARRGTICAALRSSTVSASWLVRSPQLDIVLNEHYECDGEIIFTHACKRGCEGIEKRIGSPYRSGAQRIG